MPPPGGIPVGEGETVGVERSAAVYWQPIRLHGPDLHPVRDDENLISLKRDMKQSIALQCIMIMMHRM